MKMIYLILWMTGCEGKVYDTSVEDKLLEEMRQSRIAQAENLKKLMSNPVKHASNESVQKKKG